MSDTHAFNCLLNKMKTFSRSRLEAVLNNAVRRANTKGCETSALVADVIKYHCGKNGLRISGRTGSLQILGREIFVIESLYTWQDMYASHETQGLHRTSHDGDMPKDRALKAHMAKFREIAGLLDNAKMIADIVVSTPGTGNCIQMAAVRKNENLENVCNRLFYQFRKRPSCRLLDVISEELHDAGATDAQVANFENICLGVINDG